MGLFSCCTNNVIENVVTETIQTPLPPGSISGPVHHTVNLAVSHGNFRLNCDRTGKSQKGGKVNFCYE